MSHSRETSRVLRKIYIRSLGLIFCSLFTLQTIALCQDDQSHQALPAGETRRPATCPEKPRLGGECLCERFEDVHPYRIYTVIATFQCGKRRASVFCSKEAARSWMASTSPSSK